MIYEDPGIIQPVWKVRGFFVRGSLRCLAGGEDMGFFEEMKLQILVANEGPRSVKE